MCLYIYERKSKNKKNNAIRQKRSNTHITYLFRCRNMCEEAYIRDFFSLTLEHLKNYLGMSNGADTICIQVSGYSSFSKTIYTSIQSNDDRYAFLCIVIGYWMRQKEKYRAEIEGKHAFLSGTQMNVDESTYQAWSIDIYTV